MTLVSTASGGAGKEPARHIDHCEVLLSQLLLSAVNF